MSLEIKAAQRAPILAAAHRGGQVQIWKWKTAERLSHFHTVYDGLSRLAISQSGHIFVAANWKTGPQGGVAGYTTESGEMIWHRPDLGQVQKMRFSEHGPWLWCDVANQPVHCLDAITGETLATWPTVLHVFDGPFSPRLLLVGSSTFVIGRSENHIEIPRANISFRDAVFAPDALIVCERDIVRSINIESGDECWRYVAPNGSHLTRLSYQSDQFVYAKESSGPGSGERVVRLMRFSLDGANSELCRLGSTVQYDGFGDGVFITSIGDVISLQTGHVIRQLALS